MGLMACFLDAANSSQVDCHAQDEVILILSGHGAVDVAGELTDIGPRDVVVLPKNSEHVVHNRAAAPLVWVSLYWPLHEPESRASS